MKINNGTHSVLDRLTLIRSVYRSLLQRGRTYAAFDSDRIIPLISQLAPRKTILDPMAGYGTIITLCAASPHKVSAFCIESNPPAYLWQLVITPCNAEQLIGIARHVMKARSEWPKALLRSDVSENWYPEESIRILLKLLSVVRSCSMRINESGGDTTESVLALLVPFVGRLSSHVQGNVVTHVKKGGLCVYEDWENDFLIYLKVLIEFLQENLRHSNKLSHTSLLADCLNVDLCGRMFSAMITSPPYPNGRNYELMFGPENAFLQLLENEGLVKGYTLNHSLIGSPRVSRPHGAPKMDTRDINSTTAAKFVEAVKKFPGSKRVKYDNEVYYGPYFAKYFVELETAYRNVSSQLTNNFEGYIIVVNNTHRRMIVPVAQVVQEVWVDLGFDASILPEYTRELSHVGGINPKVKGFAARHSEYTIKISRA